MCALWQLKIRGQTDVCLNIYSPFSFACWSCVVWSKEFVEKDDV